MQTYASIFSVVFLLWLLLGGESGAAKDDKKKKQSKGGGGTMIALLFAPFVAAGWLLFGLGQVIALLIQGIIALLEQLMPMLRKAFEMLGKLLEWIWAALKGLVKNILRFLRSAFSFAWDLIRDFPKLLKTLGNILKPFPWLLNAIRKFVFAMIRFVRDGFGRILDMLFLLMDGALAFISRGNRKTKGYVTKDIDETDPTDAADLLMAFPLAVATAATRTKKTLKNGRQHMIATNPLKKGITYKKKSSDPLVMKRLQHIGWETRRKMGKA